MGGGKQRTKRVRKGKSKRKGELEEEQGKRKPGWGKSTGQRVTKGKSRGKES